jgi:membrane protein DedA with SNARE-associated domain
MVEPLGLHFVASGTQHIYSIQHYVFLHLRQYRYWLVFLGTLVEGEIVLLSAGALAYFSVLNIWLVVLVGTIGTALAGDFWFWVGRHGGEPFIHRYGKFVGLGASHVARAHAFLAKHGSGAVAASRFVFGIKSLTALLAGALGMPPRKFHLANFAGAAAWVAAVTVLGYTFARSFRLLRSIVLEAELCLLILVCAAGIITLLLLSRSRHRKDHPHHE